MIARRTETRFTAIATVGLLLGAALAQSGPAWTTEASSADASFASQLVAIRPAIEVTGRLATQLFASVYCAAMSDNADGPAIVDPDQIAEGPVSRETCD
jgi:hypothetical protein